MAKKTVAELWEEIFLDYKVLDAINRFGYFKISADNIRAYKEPRLMTKFDYYKQLPRIFKDNKLGILPIKNGEYIIGRYNLFKNISGTNYEDIEPIKKQLPSYIETIDPDNIYSESNALNVALLSGMLSDLIGEDVVETIQGKMRTNGFEFEIEGSGSNQTIVVEKPAIEIDGGYEGKKNIILVEAKNNMPEDFIIRQLYYPYRHWKDKVTKKIIPVFLGYENGIYNFFVYNFDDINKYNSIKLKEIKRYIISSKSSYEIKKKIFESIELIQDRKQIEIPFSQADSFTKIVSLIDLFEEEISAQEVSEYYDFELRQGSYYISAAKYLGIVQGKKSKYKLTEQGFIVANTDMKTRNEILIRLILRHKVFYYTYKYYLENEKIPSSDYIIELMKKHTDIPKESNKTFRRRSSTVKGWIQWIIGAQV